jgi:hypothetical protein
VPNEVSVPLLAFGEDNGMVLAVIPADGVAATGDHFLTWDLPPGHVLEASLEPRAGLRERPPSTVLDGDRIERNRCTGQLGAEEVRATA